MIFNKKIKKGIAGGLLSLLILLLVQCNSYPGTSQLQNGDLLFVTAKESGLSGAINNVTQKQKTASFDHIGILEKEGKKLFVLHAAPKGGSQKQSLNDFVKDQKKDQQKDQQNIVVYRLKAEYQESISVAIENAHSMLGKPYNFNYILDENSYYCSDFVERAFRDDHIFKLEPMTFMDPKTGKINRFWEEFYTKKKLKVPEGEPGCNPNGLAGSEKLERVGEL
ncbi:YiiX/YebB-like N1pC/P60 family cysteine hydrolase [Chryseobacterium sp. BIGb0232]|uniref:YiiX/YebB-like N1pC/P60 family cysteine hydrolase n=1 Tax=Chryseobacterium sp. BIGb0232 TaxID=2940598 RepID=UPI000F480520|nr:YiiX/YebB-like N1pC/P60 family cysteine hydrolase [Chryseobacterium sp. BIGb0232]MCS4303526.1 cell wall-associated NlpC family hydrolase [Chryseobacterium sp. BIGb0232]ROS11203.1 permuted papain-like amidase YaeF/Yiix C92 family enzyme [Chryseobacterium nakagawai]